MPTKNWARKCFTEAHRFGAAQSYAHPSPPPDSLGVLTSVFFSLELGIVDKLVPEAETVDEACKLGSTVAKRATTGVYGMIKVRLSAFTFPHFFSDGAVRSQASLYKPQVDILAQHEGYQSPGFEDDYRTMKLGDVHAGKSKL